MNLEDASETRKLLDEMRGALAVHDLLLIALAKRLPLMDLASVLGEFDQRCNAYAQLHGDGWSGHFKAGFERGCAEMKSGLAERGSEFFQHGMKRAGD